MKSIFGWQSGNHIGPAEMERLRIADEMLKHEHLRSEVLNYMIDHDDDPIELLKNFAERIRVLFGCDQVIYRDLEETRIMVNSPSIEDTWAVPVEYCKQCKHFDAHHPMYAGGYTEMSNCQKGWQGIPVYEKCPIKSSLTRLVFCDGEIAGYLAIHYVQNYHTFNDLERKTLEEFTRILSISLSRYESKRKSSELEGLKRTMNMVFSLSDEFDPIMTLNPETGEYNWYMGLKDDVTKNTAMSDHGTDFYRDIAMDIASVIHEDDKEQFKAFYTKENMMKIARTGETQEIENRWYVETEGRYKWKYNKAVRMVDDNGNTFIVIGVIDTTEKKEKENEHKAQKQQIQEDSEIISGLASEYLSLYYINLHDHVFKIYSIDGNRLADTKKILSRETDAFEAMYQFAKASVHPDDAHLFLGLNAESVLARLANIKKFTVRFRRDYGQGYMWSEMDVVKYEDKDEPANSVIIGFAERDKEIRKEIEQQKQLENALAEAQSASQAKTTFLNNMSHDIRTPLNAIIGFNDIALRELKKNNGAKVADCLDKVGRSSESLLTIINDILEISRIEAGKVTLAKDKGDVLLSFANIESMMEELARKAGVDLQFSFGKVADRFVICDFAHSARVFTNLISNSIKYTEPGGWVKVNCEQIGRNDKGCGIYRYTVEDNGIGISEEFQKNLFQRFSREATSTVTKIQGTGLGLAMCKDIVELMGGSISCKSEKGKGSKFTVDLPFEIQEGKDYVNPDYALKDDSKTFKSKRVLLVEDNELNREIATATLEEFGLVVFEADDGDVAVELLEKASEGDYDIILMDVQMPRMNGYEATRRIRALNTAISRIPIIAMTANAFAEDRRDAIDAGMNGHLAKPIDLDKLKDTLSRHL